MNKIHDLRLRNADSKVKYVVMDGVNFQRIEDFVDYVEKELEFPVSCGHDIGMLDRFNDWIRDLTWFDYDTYIFIIYNYDEFLKNDVSAKQWVISVIFEEIVLPWWEKDVVNCMVGGKTKNVQLYLF